MSSYWIDSTLDLFKGFNELDSDFTADVCIIGGGISGVSCGYLLSKAGLNVILLERDRISTKTTGNTTGKITSQHGLFYKYLTDTFGFDFAKGYLDANQQAISDISNIINNENIDCDFETQDNYVFGTSDKDIKEIKDELACVNSLGFNAEYVTKFSAPVNFLGAIKFPNQAQFHPRKYILGLCNCILNNKGQIYENTVVYDIEKTDDFYTVFTKNNKIKAKYVIMATRYPIVNSPGFYFLKMYQESSYIIGVETNAELFDGMYISNSSPTISLRTAKLDNGKRLLLVGGSNHKVGANIDNSNAFLQLEDYVKNIYPNCKIKYKWNTEDCVSLDKIPYIGEFSSLMPNVFVATGFKKWGMTTSNVAANIICNKILGASNNYEDIFLSTRFHPIKNHEEMKNMLKEVSYSLVINKLRISKDSLKDVSPGDGKIIDIDGKRVGVYMDEDSNIFAIKPVCSHLGCELKFNNLFKTWDCPCHGSRFDYTGKVLYAPTVKGLQRYDID